MLCLCECQVGTTNKLPSCTVTVRLPEAGMSCSPQDSNFVFCMKFDIAALTVLTQSTKKGIYTLYNPALITYNQFSNI